MFKKDRLLLPDDEAVSDSEIDEVLRAIYYCNRTLRYLNVHAIHRELANKNINYAIDKVTAATCILYNEGFIRPHAATSEQGSPTTLWEITFPGIGFINSDTYVKRAKRWKREEGIKKFTYHTRWIVLLISIGALVISFIALNKPNEEKHVLLMPSQKWIKEVKKVDTIFISKDSAR